MSNIHIKIKVVNHLFYVAINLFLLNQDFRPQFYWESYKTISISYNVLGFKLFNFRLLII